MYEIIVCVVAYVVGLIMSCIEIVMSNNILTLHTISILLYEVCEIHIVCYNLMWDFFFTYTKVHNLKKINYIIIIL